MNLGEFLLLCNSLNRTNIYQAAIMFKAPGYEPESNVSQGMEQGLSASESAGSCLRNSEWESL